MAVSKKAAPVKKMVKVVKKAAPAKKVTSVKKTVKSVPAKTAASKAAKKEVISLVNMRLTTADKLAIQKAAQKAGHPFTTFAADAIQNRMDGIAPVKKYPRKDVGNRDAVITCRLALSQKKKVVAEAKKAGVSVSVYILDAVFGQY